MDQGEVLWIVRGYQRRLDQTDDLLSNLAKNIVAPPTKGSKKRPKIDVAKLKLYREASKEELPEGDDDPNKVIVLEERRKTMQEMDQKYGPGSLVLPGEASPPNEKGS